MGVSFDEMHAAEQQQRPTAGPGPAQLLHNEPEHGVDLRSDTYNIYVDFISSFDTQRQHNNNNDETSALARGIM